MVVRLCAPKTDCFMRHVISILAGLDQLCSRSAPILGCVLQEKQLVEFDNARVLIADSKIETIKEIIPVLEKISQLNAPLLIIAEDITGK